LPLYNLVGETDSSLGNGIRSRCMQSEFQEETEIQISGEGIGPKRPLWSEGQQVGFGGLYLH